MERIIGMESADMVSKEGVKALNELKRWTDETSKEIENTLKRINPKELKDVEKNKKIVKHLKESLNLINSAINPLCNVKVDDSLEKLCGKLNNDKYNRKYRGELLDFIRYLNNNPHFNFGNLYNASKKFNGIPPRRCNLKEAIESTPIVCDTIQLADNKFWKQIKNDKSVFNYLFEKFTSDLPEKIL